MKNREKIESGKEFKYYVELLETICETKFTIQLSQSWRLSFMKNGVDEEKITLRTLSPVVVFSTLLRPDGRKYTCYFQPEEPDYDLLVENNLRKKYHAYYGKEAPAGEVKVKRIGEIRQNLVSYKDTIIKGYSGKMVITGPKELLQMAVDAGLGSKNGQGFGCVEVCEKPARE